MNLETLDRWRHRIPFWWWLTYDALVAVVILLGYFGFRAATLWVGFAVLAVAVVIDVIEFVVKRPSAKAKLAAQQEFAQYGDIVNQRPASTDTGPWNR